MTSLYNCLKEKQMVFIIALSLALIISLIGINYNPSYKEIAIAIIGIAGGFIGGRQLDKSMEN